MTTDSIKVNGVLVKIVVGAIAITTAFVSVQQIVFDLRPRVKCVEDDINRLKISDAVKDEQYKNIMEKLDRIERYVQRRTP